MRLWFKKKQNKIDEEIVLYHFSDDLDLIEREIKSSNIGMGYVNIPTEKLRISNQINNAVFKKCINDFFKSEISKLGFIGKDYKYVKEYKGFTAIIYFIPWRYGGGTQVELFVKINDIKYPPDFKSFKPAQSLKYCEFRKRLAPINISVWVWPYEDSDLKNHEILNDILRVINEKGLIYFSQFEDLDKIVNNLSILSLQIPFDNSLSYETGLPWAQFIYYQGLIPANYFVFEYARLNGNYSKALEHARFGLTLMGLEQDSFYHIPYHEVYNNFIDENKLK